MKTLQKKLDELWITASTISEPGAQSALELVHDILMDVVREVEDHKGNVYLHNSDSDGEWE